MRLRSVIRGASLALFVVVAMSWLSACGPKKVEPDPNAIKKPEPVDPLMAKTVDGWFLEGVNYLQETPANYEAATIRFENALKRGDGKHVDSLVNLAVIGEKTGDYELAVARYKEILEIDSEDYRHHMALGRAQMGASLYDDAIGSFRQAISREVKCLDGYNGMALAYLKKGDFKQSEQMAKEVLLYDSKNLVALNTLGILYRQQKKPALAEYVLGRALEADGANPEVLNNLGLLAFEAGKIPKAVEFFTAAAEASPKFVQARLNLGAIYLDFLDYAAALAQFEEAYALSPTNEAAHLGYAASLYGSGEYEKAAELYESFAVAHPEADQPAVRLSGLYERQLANPEKACTWYTKLAEFQPDNQEVSVMRDFNCKAAAKE